MQEKPKKKILTEMSPEMLENSSLAFLVIHEFPNPTFKLLTLVRALSILGCITVYASLLFPSLHFLVQCIQGEESVTSWSWMEHTTHPKGRKRGR